MKTMKKTTTAAAGLAALALTLSACGGGDDEAPEPQGNGGGQEQTAEEPEAYVYDFEQAKAGSDAESYHVPDGEAVTVQLSNELAAVLPEESSVPVQSYTLTARSFEATGVCVLEAEIDYAPGGEQIAEEWIETGEYRVGPYTYDVNTMEVVDSIPSDDQLERNTAYLLSDLSGLVAVADCSDDPEDRFERLYFHDGISGGNWAFANIDVAVQPDGAITLFSPSVEGADVSASGEWAYKELSDNGAVDEMEGIDDF